MTMVDIAHVPIGAYTDNPPPLVQNELLLRNDEDIREYASRLVSLSDQKLTDTQVALFTTYATFRQLQAVSLGYISRQTPPNNYRAHKLLRFAEPEQTHWPSEEKHGFILRRDQKPIWTNPIFLEFDAGNQAIADIQQVIAAYTPSPLEKKKKPHFLDPYKERIVDDLKRVLHTHEFRTPVDSRVFREVSSLILCLMDTEDLSFDKAVARVDVATESAFQVSLQPINTISYAAPLARELGIDLDSVMPQYV